jgi:tRNA(Arg) A34 adenosine deaminase TadA
MAFEEKYMRRAIELSRNNVANGRGGPFGAVVVKEGKVIGEGWNKVTAHNDPTAHAEIEAIRAACANIKNFDLAGAEIYASCEPCPMCLSAIYWARLSKIYYANTKADAAAIEFDDEHIYEELSKNHQSRKIPAEQLLREEALEVFEMWQNSTTKVAY